MDTIQRTMDVLAEAEKALASLASEAAMQSRYEAASCLIDSAREVNSLATTILQKLNSAFRERALADPKPEGANKTTVLPVRRGKSQKSKYPKFLRQGGELVKIGWSRSEKAEYEHKCPKNVLPLLANAIAKAGANGKRFGMDRVIPLLDVTDSRRIPDYQVYLCLAWFREVGLVIQHGRQGYSLASKAPVEPVMESHWINLPVR